MKRKTKPTALMALLLLTVGLSARGQEYLQRSDYPGAITATIVRDYQASSAISYVESGGRHYFSLDDGSPTILNMEIDSTLTVRDFVVHGDYVYFCGENDIPQAIVGWFNIPSFFTMQGNLYLYTPYYGAISPFVKQLSSIVAYDNQGIISIVAVGGSQNGRATIVSLQGTEDIPTGWACEVGESSESSERMYKVCATDNYVVTAGTIFNDRDGISLRIFRKNNLFAPGGPQDRFHRYSSEDSNLLQRCFSSKDAKPSEALLDSALESIEDGHLYPLMTNRYEVVFTALSPAGEIFTGKGYDCQQ